MGALKIEGLSHPWQQTVWEAICHGLHQNPETFSQTPWGNELVQKINAIVIPCDSSDYCESVMNLLKCEREKIEKAKLAVRALRYDSRHWRR